MNSAEYNPAAAENVRDSIISDTAGGLVLWAGQEPEDELDQLLAAEGLLDPPGDEAVDEAPAAGGARTVDDDIAEIELAGSPAADDTADDDVPAGQPHQPSQSNDLSLLVRQLAERTIREDQQRDQERRRVEAEEAARRAETPPLFDSAALELTPEEQATYAASAPVIEKLVRRELMAYHDRTKPVGAQTFEELRQQVTSFRPAVEQSAETAFSAALRSGVPDLDARVANPAWQQYLDQPVPFQGGVTFRQALQSAVEKERNLPKAMEIIRGFQHVEAAPKARAMTPGRPGSGAPASVAASVKRGGDKQAKLKYSTFQKASDMMSAGKLDPQKYQSIVDRFMDADEQGLVDYAA